MPDVVIEGGIEEADPPRKLVHTYRFLFSEAMKAEGFTRVTWEIEKVTAGFARLTVIHELEGAPNMAGIDPRGWPNQRDLVADRRAGGALYSCSVTGG